MEKFKKYGLWAIMGLTAALCIGAGSAKLAGVPMLHQSFATLGLPVFFGYFIGACEVAGGIGLFIKKLSSLAALGLAFIMAGAAYYHINYDMQGLPPSIVLLVFCGVIFFARKKYSFFAKSA